jgi:hypothetical protein
MAVVCVLAARPSASLGDQLPARAQIGEAGRHQSSPADKVQSSPAGDLGYLTFPTFEVPRPLDPIAFKLSWVEADGRRPGHRQRIDRPPRLRA